MNINSGAVSDILREWGCFYVIQQGQHFFIKGKFNSDTDPYYNIYAFVFSWKEIDRMSIEEFEEVVVKKAVEKLFGHE